METQETTRRDFLERMSEIPIIDTHSHTRTEDQYYANGPYNLFTLNSYFSRDILGLVNGEPYINCVTDDERWVILKSALDKGRNISYWRHNIVTYKKLFGLEKDDLDDNNWSKINKAIFEKSQDPNWYDYTSRKVYDIKTQVRNIPWFEEWMTADLVSSSDDDIRNAKWRTDWDKRYFTGVLRMEYAFFLYRLPLVEKLSRFTGVDINSLTSLEQAVESIIDIYLKKGAIGVKFTHAYFRTLDSKPVERMSVEKLFSKALTGQILGSNEVKTFQDYLLFFIAGICSQRDLLFQIHTGIQNNWDDVSNANPLHLVPLLSTFPKVRFDLFHAGIPFIHEAGVLCKLFHNTHMNMTWTYVISMAMARQALSEFIDLIPGSRILAFGSDVQFPEFICGHLEMAFSCVADVLAHKVSNDFLSKNEAFSLIDRMFYKNGMELYRL